MPKSMPMRLLNEPQPLHHASVVRPFEDMNAAFTARVLLLRRPDGTVEPYIPFIKYQRKYRLRSASWQNATARALGLFWDFCVAHRGTGWPPRTLLQEFAYALLEGTIDSKRPASRSLMWPSISRERAKGLIKNIEVFAEWCASNDETLSPLARDEVPLVPGTGEHATRLLVWSRVSRVSMLQHIKAAPKTAKRSSVDLGRDGKGKELQAAKFFPPAFAERLLWEGHRRPNAETEPDIFRRYNIRDMMIALLDGWGGLRRSEGLHLWEIDVREDEDHQGHAFVVLNHPEEAKVQWHDPVASALRWISRKEMLARRYGLRARNVSKRGHYHVGWKGMALNENYQASIFWIDPAAGALFWTLYLAYIRFVRLAVMDKRKRDGGKDHPFLFVSEEVNPETGLVGEPYSEKAYERNHAAAVRRLGLKHEKSAGTTTHGLRHLYGHTMQKLGVHPHVIRQGLHHVNLLSQAIYTVPLPAEVDEALRAAQRRLADGYRTPASLGESTSEALLRLRQSLSNGGFV
ncbi:site-specific integrase [Bradyrhizobium liaoningense]|uniref:site-specific integrase n=1 Tax=Bradyrhizobium liaoningense TaxID=43992 RepID=UPI001BAAEF4D|nr:site-specific integrase [Bradyrhizobium liaoningense]MBR0841742.1 site-specific integrase [Bradyrhizobium liaoningense]